MQQTLENYINPYHIGRQCQLYASGLTNNVIIDVNYTYISPGLDPPKSSLKGGLESQRKMG